MELKGPCVDESVRSTIEAVTYSDISETDLHTFFQMMRLEIEGRIQEHEIQSMVAEDENEDSGPRRSPEHVKELIKVKTRSFLSMVDEIRDKAFTGAIEVWKTK